MLVMMRDRSCSYVNEQSIGELPENSAEVSLGSHCFHCLERVAAVVTGLQKPVALQVNSPVVK